MLLAHKISVIFPFPSKLMVFFPRITFVLSGLTFITIVFISENFFSNSVHSSSSLSAQLRFTIRHTIISPVAGA